MSFDFPLAETILAGVKTGDASGIAAKIAEVQALYPPGAIDAPFLTNHDQTRIATQLGDDPPPRPGAVTMVFGVGLGRRRGWPFSRARYRRAENFQRET
jgi:hypothetical protein